MAVLFALAAETRLLAGDVTQTTGNGSWCSPAQNGNNNTVICNGVDPRAMDRLNELLDRKDLDLKQKTAEANDWAHKYDELNAQLEQTKKQLAAKGQDATLVQSAQDLLHEGKLEDAHAIFDRLIQSDEANVDRAAQDHFGRASLFALQFRLDEALPDYAKAYQYRPDDLLYAQVYASMLVLRQDPRSDAALHDLLRQWRTRATQDPATYWPSLATTLNKLAEFYDDEDRFGDEETALKEAAAIRRELAAHDPAYRPDLAETLANLGGFYGDANASRFDEAEAALKEAAAIRRELAASDPACRSDLAQTLTILGVLYRNKQRFADAEAAYHEAAALERELAMQNPANYGPDLVGTLNNLASLYRDMHRESDAKAAEAEATDAGSSVKP
jgi:tetratricopeptide (TPR) repeat protein